MIELRRGAHSACRAAKYTTCPPPSRQRMPSGEQLFIFNSLDSKQPKTARKLHIRRVFDVLNLCIQRRDWPRAKRAWAILARCKEVDWKQMWRISLLLLGETGDQGDSGQSHEDRVSFLTVMMRQHPEEVRACRCNAIPGTKAHVFC